MNSSILEYLTRQEIESLSSCSLCPRNCEKNRIAGERGFCNIDVSLSIALIINHKGEEPILSKNRGITNLFFSHCNCQCIFCQNYKISSNKQEAKSLYSTMDEVIDRIIVTLKTSENVLGFVSPTHQIPIMKAIIRELHKKGVFPTIVYNCSGYENVEVLKELDAIVDVYLPDMKYFDKTLSKNYSFTPNYYEIAIQSLKEMYRQKGSSILTDKNGDIESGLIIRHLLLPDCLEDSKKVLDAIAWELSPNVTLSLMSQYNPPYVLPYENLNKKVSRQEYEELLEFALDLGFHKIYSQDLSSTNSVIPDFDNDTFIDNI